jgi:hypothetical protein
MSWKHVLFTYQLRLVVILIVKGSLFDAARGQIRPFTQDEITANSGATT